MKQINIDKRLFNKCYLQIWNKTQSLMMIYGGGSSGKSRALSAMIVLFTLRGEACLVARQTLVSIKKSVWLEITKRISEMKLLHLFKINKSDSTIICIASGGSVQFVGCEDVERIKSITPIHKGAFSKLWIEEATEISRDSITQLRIRMRGKSEFNKQTILTYNPIFKGHHLYKDYFEPIKWTDNQTTYEDNKIFILKTTYLDNRFLDQSEIDYLESLKEKTPYFYEVYTKGNFGTLGHRIFENWSISHFNQELMNIPIFVGGDFGFTIDPATVIYCKYDERNKVIYIIDEIYEKELTNNIFADRIIAKHELLKFYNPTIFFDSAEPKSIQELRNYKINALATNKGKDSISKGIDWLLQHNIVVHPKCVKTIEELQLYVRKEKQGEIQMEPEDKNNHLMDALRYAFNTKWSNFSITKSFKSNIY